MLAGNKIENILVMKNMIIIRGEGKENRSRHFQYRSRILEQSMEARYREGIELSYRPTKARICSLDF
jgi:hypothetical protein